MAEPPVLEEDGEPSKGTKERNLRKISLLCGAAILWQKNEFPGLSFLKSVGLGGLANVDWRFCPRDLITEFIANFNTESSSSMVQGRCVVLSADIISEKLGLSNQGYVVSVDSENSRLDIVDPMKFFKEGAQDLKYQLGFRINMLKDPSLLYVFRIITSVVMLRRRIHFMPAYTLEVLERASRGEVVNWSKCMHERIVSKLKDLKEEVSSDQGILSLAVGSLIAHLILDDHEVTTTSSVSKQQDEEESDGGVKRKRGEMPPGDYVNISYRHLRRKTLKLEKEIENLQVRNEMHLAKQQQLLTQLDEVTKAKAKLEQQVEEQTTELTALRAALAVKELPYSLRLWEDVQKEVWKQTRASYRNLQDTIAVLTKLER